MVQFSMASLLLCAVTSQGPALQVVVQTARQDYLAERLIEAVNFDGFDDPRTTLQDALDYLADRYDLSFDIDESAFVRRDGKGLGNIQISENRPILQMRAASLDAVLNKILSRLPPDTEPTFLVQRRGIVITSKKAASKLVLGDESKPLPPLVHAKYENRPLQEALNDIAHRADVNVVLDNSIAEKAGETVSARFMNTPVDSAVRVLADRYNFTSLRMDNVIYVTTRERAAKLREDIERDKKQARQMPPAD
jgi:hypothetical protein